MDKVATIASQSSTDGANTVKALTTPGLGAAAIVKKLNAIAAQEAQNVVGRTGALAAREAARPAHEPDRGARAARERRQGARERLPEHDRVEDQGGRRGARALAAGLPAARQRRRVGRPLQGALRERPRHSGRARGDRALLALPRRARPRGHRARDDPDPRSHHDLVRHDHADRPPRDEHPVGGGAAERHRRGVDAVGSRSAEHGHDELEPRARGDGAQRRELAGGADPGHVDDRPARVAGRPDHEDGEDPADRPGDRTSR